MIGRLYGFSKACRLTCLSRRQFSVKAIYSSFPATLHHYSPSRRSSLFNHDELDSRPNDLYCEAVALQKDGRVHPAVGQGSVSNGAIMYPNTFMMQELTRHVFDDALDREDKGKHVETPFIFTIHKGTPVPAHLILINDYMSQFSLQPSHGMLLKDLNQSLDDFYNTHAQKESAAKWIDAHPYEEAIPDDKDDIWMKQRTILINHLAQTSTHGRQHAKTRKISQNSE